MTKLTILTGLPASGKSLFARKLSKPDTLVVSSDETRERLYGDEKIQGDNNKLFELLHQECIRLLSKERNVIFDATNLTCKHRMAFLQKLNKLDVYKECLIVATPYQDCLYFNSQRERKVPEQVIERMWKSFQVPAYFEGWDKIDVLWNGNFEKYDLDETLLEMDSFSQDNPHHSLSLGDHSKDVNEDLSYATNNELVKVAGLLHDVGKLHSKVFKDAKGNPSNIAHFYNHENCGAYESLFYLKSEGFSDNDILYISALINYHMRPYGFAESEKAKEKFKNLVGQEFFDDIMLIHEADKLAH